MAQRITCVDLDDGHAIVCGALQVELGRTYRVTGTVDTANVPRGTPIEFRITHTSRVIEPGDEAERGLQGQCVVYADGTVRDIDIRWTNFTPGDAFLAVYLTGDYCGRDGNLVRPGVSPGDHVVVDALDFQPFDDTLWGRPLEAIADVTEIRKAGAVFRFNRPVRAGLYANRDLWFRDLDPGNGTPLKIISVEPEWFRQHVTLTPRAWTLENGVAKNTFGIVPSAEPTPDFWGVNGTEINPWREGWEWRPNAGSPNNQGFEDRFSTSFADYRATLGKTLEPYDHPVYLNKEYDAPFNRDPAATGRPIEPAPGDTVVKCLSYAEPPSRGENGARARVAAYISVTCVAADVPAGSFRPYPGAADKTPTHTISDLNLSLLPDLPSPADDEAAPRWHEAARMAYYMQPAHLRQFPPNEGIVQSLATSVYSRPHTEDTSSHFAAGLITDAFTPERKAQLAYAVVQYGLDLYQDNLIRKIAWAESGGKLCKKPYAVLAAVLLDDAGMKAVISASTGQYDVTTNGGKPAEDRIYPWHEDCVWGPLIPECVTEPRGLYISRATGKARGAMKYFPENVGMPSLQDSASPWIPWADSGGNPPGMNSWSAAYRLIGPTRALPGILMMHIIPGAREVFANDIVLDWYDMMYRYCVSVRPSEGVPGYHAALWKAYRSGGVPVPVHRFGLDDETDYSPSQARAIMADDFELQTGRAMTDTDWSVSKPADGVPRMRIFEVGRPMTFPLAPEWFVTSGGSHLDARSVPTSYSVVDGALPAGLSLDAATGVISGTPSAVSPQRPDLPPDPTVRAVPVTIRATDVTVLASNARGSSAQLIRFAVVPN